MLDDITRHSFSLASSEAGLGSVLALKRFDRMAELFPSALEKAASQLVCSGYPEAENLKKMIQLHGGTITAASEEGKGTTFTIELPLIQK